MTVDKDAILTALSLEEIEALAERKRQLLQQAEEQSLVQQSVEIDERLGLLEDKRRLLQTEREKLSRRLAEIRGEEDLNALEKYHARINNQPTWDLLVVLHRSVLGLGGVSVNYNKGSVAYFHRSKLLEIGPRYAWLYIYFPKQVKLHEFLPEEERAALRYAGFPERTYEQVYLSPKNQEHVEALIGALQQVVSQRPEFRL